jgi:HSP20 family protein
MVRTLIPRVWRPLDLLGPQWDRAFENVFGSDPFGVLDALSGATEREGFLALDLWESPTALHLEVDLPGVRAADVDVQVHAGELTLKVARQDGAQEGERWLRRERGTGSYTRTFALPADVDASAVDAQLADGVLRVSLPKSPRAMPRAIEIKTTGQ